MTDSSYPDDIQFAGLVQAATAAADEQTRVSSALGKRRRLDDEEHLDDSHHVLDDTEGMEEMNNPQLQNSAAVLFREPSEKSRKYSRPPLGKVFSSLELAPETFLRLQSAAKDFMLSPDHPERRDVVGHKKHSGAPDVAKLKLWTCVEDFLLTHGNGEKFFGLHAGDGIPGTPPRTMFWPEDSQRIVRLCMPVMRKMITNERQRIYAAETRKQTPIKESPYAERKLEENIDGLDTPIVPDSVSDVQSNSTPPKRIDVAAAAKESKTKLQSPTLEGSVTLHVNVVVNQGGTYKRIIPRFSMTSSRTTNLSTLHDEVRRRCQSESISPELMPRLHDPQVKVWLPDGLVRVNNDGEWMVALLSVGMVEWMDEEIRILVEV